MHVKKYKKLILRKNIIRQSPTVLDITRAPSLDHTNPKILNFIPREISQTLLHNLLYKP